MTDIIRRHPIALGAALLALLMLLLSSVSVVTETRQGVVTRVGKPVRLIGRQYAGLNFTIPFVESVVWIDKRVRDLDMDTQQVLSTDQRRLEVDAFARYRVVNPLQMYLAARSVEGVEQQLAPILGSQLRNELGRRPFAALLSPERTGLMDNIQAGLNRVANQYGVEIVDVRIKKADLPDGTPLDTAFEQMRTARQQEARSILAEGQKRAQIIRAEADAEAARIYAASFGKDPQFYDFYRAMQSYQSTFLPNGEDKGADTTIILSPQNEYLREFTGRGR
ncbi:protease modulator HflC [Sphingomonas piscis]|uniref:Protease modulator HflC n=1 Tax=Sphingomonas piscis TaxID=2714943 RepID=A0A6G7YQX2_9SPHN|nr:protease modulator HflC [Sphingomonas piscis]QIK79148.1 protease modulator HflC [Sphingomonas piscis]